MMTTKLKILVVTDLHAAKALYQELGRVVKLERPDVVALGGDFLDAALERSGRLSPGECAGVLSKLACQDGVFVRGNHEDYGWWEFAAAWDETGRGLNALHGEVFVKGPLAVLGFPCSMGDETAYLGVRESLPTDMDGWLPGVVRANGVAARTLWLMHEPPANTPLAQPAGPVMGNVQWNEAIDRFSPWLTVSGHDHRSPGINKRWYCRLGQTVCVNVGQTDGGPLHYCVIEGEFPGSQPCLPFRLTVTAYTWKRSITLPPGTDKLASQ